MKYLLHIPLALLLVGCTLSDQEKAAGSQKRWHLYENTVFNYQINIPPAAYIPDKSPTKDQIFFGNIKQISKNEGAEYDIYIYSGSKAPFCSLSLTGTSQTAPLSAQNGKVEWGKVDVYDVPNPSFPPGTQPPCRPPLLKWDYDEQLGVVRLSNDAAYALCGEKDGKTVLICISQITDNPELARQIFETFRWTE